MVKRIVVPTDGMKIIGSAPDIKTPPENWGRFDLFQIATIKQKPYPISMDLLFLFI